MLRHPPGGYYDWPPPTIDEGQARWARWARWACLAAVGVGVLALVAFVVEHDPPGPGLSTPSWLMLLAAAVLLVVLSVRYHAAGAWPLARTLAEYATVALLAVLLTLATTGQQADPAATAPARATGAGCPPVRQLPAWVACLWHQANPPPAPPTTTGGRALAPSPTTLTTRRPL
jgi:hypothetical protein